MLSLIEKRNSSVKKVHNLAMWALLAPSFAAASTIATASTLTFEGDFQLLGSAFEDPGLALQANPRSDLFSFTLDKGESTTFALFDIWTDESHVGHDDRIEQDISAAVSFSTPTAFGNLSGSSVGSSVWYGFVQQGEVTWGNPLSLGFGNGGLLSIALSNETFNKGYFWGLSKGEKHGASVEMTATYEMAPVPLPTAAWLFGSALLGMAGISYRRSRNT